MSSLAKTFEHNVAQQLKQVKDTYIYRLSDLVNQFGVSNPCDYFCFHKYFYLLELKTTSGSSLPLKNISDFQYNSMYEASQIKDVKAYFIVWWYDKGITKAIPVEVIKDIKETNKKSIRFDYDDSRIINIQGNKKKLYFNYDWVDFFRKVENNGTLSSRARARRTTRVSRVRGYKRNTKYLYN